MIEVWGSFLGLLGVFSHVGRECWCSRGRVGPWMRKFSDGQPLVQRQLVARPGHSLACRHFMPGQCVQHWGVVRGTGPAVMTVPVFLGDPHRQLR